MSIKSARKLGFWTAMAMLFGSIVGIGIFFKNGSVLRATDGDGISSLLAWILGGVLSLFAAISFSEIGSQKLRNVHGLAGWTETSMGKKAGYFVRFNFAFFYYGIMMTIMGVFVSSAFFQTLHISGISTGLEIKDANGNWILDGDLVYVHIIIGLAVSFVFVALNIVSVFASGIFSTITSILKFIPIALAALMGVILATTNNAPSATSGFNVFDKSSNFTFTGMLAALPGVLFAYDSFLAIGTMSAKTNGGAKTVSRVTIVTMISVVVLYTLVSVSQLLHSTRTIQSTFAQILPSDVERPMTIFVWSFILISALGVHNGMVAVGVASIQQGFMTRTFIGDKTSAKRVGFRASLSLSVLSVYVIWSLIIFIPAIAMKSDGPIDTFSNYSTIFFFAIYGANIVAYWRKRARMSSEKINSILFYISSTIAVVGIVFVSAYQLFYGFTVRAFISPEETSSSGFLGTGDGMNLIQEFGFFAGALVIFIIAPIINYYLTLKLEKNNPIIDTQKLEIDEVTAFYGGDDSRPKGPTLENTKTVRFRTASGKVFRRKN